MTVLPKDYNSLLSRIENLFPQIYVEHGELLIQFVKAYYEFMELNYADNRNAYYNMDIDVTGEAFLTYFRNTYLDNFPNIASNDVRFVIKHIMDFYRSKGSEESIILLIKLLFGEDSEIYYPKTDIFKLSDSKWYIPRYIEITTSKDNSYLIDKQIVGSISGATGIVEGIVTKRISGKFIDVVYLSSIVGDFIKNERIVHDGVLLNSSIVTGSLSKISIENGGRNNKIGDIFKVVSSTGKGGLVRVANTVDAVGRVDFELIEGGSGYTVTDRTDIIISDKILNLRNDNLEFLDFEKVTQVKEELKLLDVDSLPNTDFNVGKTISGITSTANVVGEGIILSIDEYTESNNAVANVSVLITSGTFNEQRLLTITEPVSVSNGEYVYEGSNVNLTIASSNGSYANTNYVYQVKETDYGIITANLDIDSNTGVFTVGETIAQYNSNTELSITADILRIPNSSVLELHNIHLYSEPREFEVGREIEGLSSNSSSNVVTYTPANSVVYSEVVFGEITNSNSTVITMENVFGSFDTSIPITIHASIDPSSNILATANLTTVSVTTQGASAVINSSSGNTINIQNITGSFTTGKKIRTQKTKHIYEIANVEVSGATDVFFNANVSSNSVIDLVSNTYAIGYVVDQNSSAIGVYNTNNTTFLSTNDISLSDTAVSISLFTIKGNNEVTVLTSNTHTFDNNTEVRLDVDILKNNEIFYITDVFEVTNVTNTSFDITLSDTDIDKINGSYSIITSSVTKTVTIPIATSRSELISPPRYSNGDIIELEKNIYSISKGVNANFSIGALENEETVFLNTNFVSGNNVNDVNFLDIQLNGSNSGVGFITSILITDGGSGYSNGAVITFTGGGYADGEPDVFATALISQTDGSGAIETITITNHGSGYWNTPTLVHPSNSIEANLSIEMDYGYGFQKSPNGDEDTLLIDLLTYEEFEIGKISYLGTINPGTEYTQTPFVKVYNKYIAGFERTDMLLILENVIGSFVEGEIISQTVGEDFAKGSVLSFSGSQLIIRRTSFNTAFSQDISIIGSTSGASANVIFAQSLENVNVMGDNADINTSVISANGVASELEVIDSGYGYENDLIVSLYSPDNVYIMNGTATSINQGVGSGFWKTKTSHLNSKSKIHDNHYYQEYSYDVFSSKSLNKYLEIIKQLSHVAGTSGFTTISKNSIIEKGFTSDSSVEIIEE